MKFIGTVPPSDERVQVAVEELADFKSVWAELEKVWSQIDNLREQPWVSVQPRKVFQLSFIFCRFACSLLYLLLLLFFKRKLSSRSCLNQLMYVIFLVLLSILIICLVSPQ